MLIEVQVVGWGKEFWRLGAQNVNTVSTVRCTLTKVMLVFKAVCILPWFIFKACAFGALALGWPCLRGDTALGGCVFGGHYRPGPVVSREEHKWRNETYLPWVLGSNRAGVARSRAWACASRLTRSQSSLCVLPNWRWPGSGRPLRVTSSYPCEVRGGSSLCSLWF